MPDESGRILGAEIGEWIVGAALRDVAETEILTTVCDRLNDAGCALVRVAVGSDLLDPTLDGRGVRWNRGQGASEQEFNRTVGAEASTDWKQSPFYRLVESGAGSLRRRLDASYVRGEFPLLDRFQDEGVTDYVALIVRVADHMRLGDFGGIISSWTTDLPGGFTGAQIDILAGILPSLSLAIVFRTTGRITRTLISTYLGKDAALRVLAGNVVRGRAESITAVVWFSDLKGFTRISDKVGPAGMLALLNDYAEAQVDAIEEHGGNVLKFIGDGLLAIFPGDDAASACSRALDAAADQRRRIAAVNERRAAAGLPVTDTNLALHLGELLYGNVGSPRRLDFTVLGPAVNEAARIEALCASLDQAVVVSTAFADAAGAARSRLVSLGRYAMKGVAKPQELFTLDSG